jgi:multimeric flavodoxin WrbA
MTILIHDLADASAFLKNKPDDIEVISDNGKITPCISCYGCWVKTPGQCVVKDGYENIGFIFSKSNRIVIISKCFYGCYSPFVKNVFDRSVSNGLPYFSHIKGETHHKGRYGNKFILDVHFYGEMTEAEKETAKKLVKANGITLGQKTDVHFYKSPEEIKEVQL